MTSPVEPPIIHGSRLAPAPRPGRRGFRQMAWTRGLWLLQQAGVDATPERAYELGFDKVNIGSLRKEFDLPSFDDLLTQRRLIFFGGILEKSDSLDVKRAVLQEMPRHGMASLVPSIIQL